MLYCVSHLPDTVTVKIQVAAFPDGSLKVYVTWVVPRGKLSPGERLDVTVTVPPESSTADGSVQVAGADVAPAGAVTDTPAGQSLTTGGVVSTWPPATWITQKFTKLTPHKHWQCRIFNSYITVQEKFDKFWKEGTSHSTVQIDLAVVFQKLVHWAQHWSIFTLTISKINLGFRAH